MNEVVEVTRGRRTLKEQSLAASLTLTQNSPELLCNEEKDEVKHTSMGRLILFQVLYPLCCYAYRTQKSVFKLKNKIAGREKPKSSEIGGTCYRRLVVDGLKRKPKGVNRNNIELNWRNRKCGASDKGGLRKPSGDDFKED